MGRLAAAVAPRAAHGLETVLIGNAAAAMHGAPVTTIDFEFMFRDTPTNLRKLKGVARTLNAVVLRPCDPVSKLYRMVNDDTGLQANFMTGIARCCRCWSKRCGPADGADPRRISTE